MDTICNALGIYRQNTMQIMPYKLHLKYYKVYTKNVISK